MTETAPAAHPAKNDCLYCDWISTKKNVLYEDQHSAVVLYPQPAAAGHLLVLPKKHFTIYEQLPPETSAALGIVSNKMSVLQFETLAASGTNFLIQNGADAGQTMPHVSIHLIPRYENDKINFMWKSRPLDEEQMAVVEMGLKEQLAEEQSADQQTEHEKPKDPKTYTILRYPERIP